MPAFQSNKFRSSAEASRIATRYRALIKKHPFLTFGLPFLGVIVAGSFVLTPATAIRYEKHDRKVRQMTKDEELNVRRAPRKVDMREEYYVSAGLVPGFGGEIEREKDGVNGVTDWDCRDWLEGIWMTGSRRGWRGCRARVMAS